MFGDFSIRAAVMGAGGGALAGARACYARVGLRTLAVLIVCVAAMAGILAARLVLDDSPGVQGVTFLLAVPIAVLTLEVGLGGGVAALVGAMAGIALWAEMREVELGVLGYLTRGTIFGLTVALAAREHGRRAGRPAGHAPAGGHGNGAPHLTPRELEVLALIACGNTNRQAAARLALSVRTVEAHRARVQSKTGCAGRAELFRFATERGLIAPED